MDALTTELSTPPTIRREDYRRPAWLVPDIRLEFRLGLSGTQVTATLSVERNPDAEPDERDAPLLLDGEDISPVEVVVDGRMVNDWSLEDGRLRLDLPGARHQLRVVTELDPSANTQLMGLYASNAMLCTQCEAEGFRRITFFPDRPDVLSRYQVRLTGPREQFPVLLSNGDLVGEGEDPASPGWHFAEWRDPYPKPSYLFALVAGDLVANRDSFTTLSGRQVELAIWVREGDLPRTSHAMASLKAAMAWDERVYGREYDLDRFNIVAVSDFNMGAMENKGLNIFNTRYVLADPETATDADYDAIETVVGHEYFHNWSGNRVTCRDWFQLSLKEGFTVLRDQQFSAAMGSAALKRIEDVRVLRAAQFPEDAGPLAHPIRPDSYMEISNFYTATVYNKGAEVIRMMLTLVGPERFRRGTDLYFARHDGTAATCEDFVSAIEDGAGADLSRFRRWYATAGTPRVRVSRSFDADSGAVTLHLAQTVATALSPAGASPLAIPLRTALIDRASGEVHGEELILLDEATAEHRVTGFSAMPALSINRGFSAPIQLETDRSAEELAFLAGHDDDPFSRYEAMQQLMSDHLVATAGGESRDPSLIVEAVRRTLSDPQLDRALIAEFATAPTESMIAEQMLVIDPDAIHAARRALRTAIATALADRFRAGYAEAAALPYSRSPEARAARRFAGSALAYLQLTEPQANFARAWHQFEQADNMTARLSALAVLASSDAPQRVEALDAFYTRYRSDPLVIDKWFAIQAGAERDDVVDTVRTLAGHPDFTLTNPNRVRALYGSFAGNQRAFNDLGGAGYHMLGDLILALDATNPQTAARFVPPLGRWRRMEPRRCALMKAELERLRDRAQSRDVVEQVVKSLA